MTYLCLTKVLQNGSEGVSNSNRKKCRRKKNTTERQDRALDRVAKKSRFQSTSHITEACKQASGTEVLRSTTYRRLRQLEYRNCIAATKPLLNKKQMLKRLQWATARQTWTAYKWQRVTFSDESRFCISFGDQGLRVWRRTTERYNQECAKKSELPTVLHCLGLYVC